MRARNIKPSFFKNEDLAECNAFARLLFVGLWCMATKEGIVELRPKKIKAEVFPYESANIKIEKLLEQLRKFQFISILQHPVSQRQIILINKFSKHQSPHKNEKSCDLDDLQDYQEISGNSMKVLSPLLKEERGKRNDERGKVKGSMDSFEYDVSLFSDDLIAALFKHRKAKKSPIVTQQTLTGIMNQCIKCSRAGLFKTPADAMLEILERGWCSIKPEWITQGGNQTPPPETEKKIDDEFFKCGFCMESITGCEQMKHQQQKGCGAFKYHGGSVLGLKRSQEIRTH